MSKAKQAQSVRILFIASDGRSVAEGTEELKDAGYVVEVETQVTAGLSRARSGSYQIVVINLMTSNLSDLATLIQLRQSTPSALMLLTSPDCSLDVAACLEIGAADCITAPFKASELVARVRAIERRTNVEMTESEIAVDYLVSGQLKMWPRQRRAEWRALPLPLTSTQFSLLEALLRRVGQPVSKAALSERVLARPHTRHDRSLDMHLHALRRKLGKGRDGQPLIQTVHRFGYQLLDEL